MVLIFDTYLKIFCNNSQHGLSEGMLKWENFLIGFKYFWVQTLKPTYDNCGPEICPCKLTRHVFVKHGCPRRQQSQNMAKISKSYILTPPHPQGHVMSVKCEEHIDELTVQVWLLYHHPNLKYCTLFVSGTELQTDRRTEKQTDRRSHY